VLNHYKITQVSCQKNLTKWLFMKSSSFEDKWGNKTTSVGWVAIPTSLIFLQEELKITAVEFNVLINLIMHWWDVDKKPFPAQSAIAHRMGMSKRSIQRALDTLEEKELIITSQTEKKHAVFKGRNLYDLSPLVKILNDKSQILRENLRLDKERIKAKKEGELG